jgi:pyruvate kinase
MYETSVYVATNLLESMINHGSPTRAEANDVASTLLMGASGLVLAAETAIGQYPDTSFQDLISS